VVAALDRIAVHPEIGAATVDDPVTRRVLVDRFPYQVIDELRRREVLVLAFAHLKRRPGFWKHRG
jgi:plasmid stabilization system protein ParE